jgi:hypothetical protein
MRKPVMAEVGTQVPVKIKKVVAKSEIVRLEALPFANARMSYGRQDEYVLRVVTMPAE